MSDESRIEELKRRLQKDPGSIAFAQLGEEYRRAGRFHESIDVCRTGLSRHPGYLSARVTLGRALLEIGDVDAAQRELGEVLRAAPDNLSALRGLDEIRRRQGGPAGSLEQFRAAFELAGPDPTVEQVVRDLRREPAPAPSPIRRPSVAHSPAFSPDEVLEPANPAPTAGPVPTADELRAARRTLAYLERWLQAVLADRRARLYRAPA